MTGTHSAPDVDGTRDFSKYTIIRASAGSGKTYRLVTELARRLIGEQGEDLTIDPSQIIATTFTVKAASELSSRIRTRLVESGRIEQATMMPSALIGTVNAISGRLLQDFAIDAGRSPDLTVLNEGSQRLAFKVAAAALIADAEQDHRALLVRMSYDLSEDDGSRYQRDGQSFADTVRGLVDLARANDVSADELDDPDGFARESTRQLGDVLHATAERSAAGNTETLDSRGRVVEASRELARALKAKLAKGAVPSRSVKGVTEALKAIEHFVIRHADEDPADRDQVSWRTWFRAADAKYPGQQRTPSLVAKEMAGLASDEIFSRDTAFRDDLNELAQLVFTTAGKCLRAYGDYKRRQGLIDFIDQDSLALRLLRENPQVRQTISERYRILAVDEFQDTNPLQLALFTEIGALVDEVVWVGDPKQSIYAFRGSDPSLMGAAVDAIRAGGGRIEVLDSSWRAHEVPLAFTNTIFSRVFPSAQTSQSVETTAHNPDVWLSIPPQLAGQRAGGEVALWQVQRPDEACGQLTNAEWFTSVVRGISDARERDRAGRGVPVDGSWAVLTRSNAQAAELLRLLRASGIPCVGGGTPLLSTREGSMFRAALAWLLDGDDTQALLELVSTLREHQAHDDWLEQLTKLDDRDARIALLYSWGQDRSLAPVQRLAAALPTLSVREAVVAIVDALDLRRRIAEWDEPGRRMDAISGLLAAARDYTDSSSGMRRPATCAGFLSFLAPDGHADRGPTTATVSHALDAVTVTTVHQAKGLEWDSVVVVMPTVSDRFEPAGLWLEPAQTLDLRHPLRGRSLRFWPRTILECAAIRKIAADDPLQQNRERLAQAEEQRLFYVAATRSCWRTVLAPKKDLAHTDAFSHVGFDLEVTQEPGGLQLIAQAPSGPAHELLMPCDVTDISTNAEELQRLTDERRVEASHPAAWVDRDRATLLDAGMEGALLTGSLKPGLSATFSASGLDASSYAETARVEEIARLGPPIVSRGGSQWDRVGDCVHAYLALPSAAWDEPRQQAVAERLVRQWGVGSFVSASSLVTAGNRWVQWTHAEYPGAEIATEVPVTWSNPSHQRMQGWIDQLLTLPDGGVVLVDHKTYPGSDPVDHARHHYVEQLLTYRSAVDEALASALPPGAVRGGSRHVCQMLVHLPLLGLVLSIR